jgi:hypothetical protein
MVDKESRMDFRTNGGKFNGGILSTTRDVIESSNKRGIQRSMLKE